MQYKYYYLLFNFRIFYMDFTLEIVRNFQKQNTQQLIPTASIFFHIFLCPIVLVVSLVMQAKTLHKMKINFQANLRNFMSRSPTLASCQWPRYINPSVPNSTCLGNCSRKL